VRYCAVVAGDDNWRGREVDWEIDARLRMISYRLGYEYDEPRWIAFDLFHGDMEDVRGAYTLEPDGHGNTEVTLSLRVRPGVPVPGALERVLTRVLLPGALDDLERQVEDG